MKKTGALKFRVLIFIILILILALGVYRYYRRRGVNPAESSSSRDTGTVAVKEDGKRHLKLLLQNSGMDIFNPVQGTSFDYSYGGSLLLNEDGSIDGWFSSPGDGTKELDYITWRHMDSEEDGFSVQKVVLRPTPGSMDTLSTCDPDVFYYDGYYYLGYTATVDPTLNGLCNSVFLARAKEPEGPYEKWNGSGWGGYPEPIVYYDGFSLGWGCGEPSFVIKDDKIYVYSTKDAYSMQGVRMKTTQVRCADLMDPMWPAKLEYLGVCVDRSDGTQEGYVFSDCDSWDVVYVEEYDRFIAMCTNRRFTMSSCLLYFESRDGVFFERISEINKNLICGCHNCGMLADGNGHIKKGDILKVCYSYAGTSDNSWGYWATRMAPLTLEEIEGVDRSEENKKNIKMQMAYDKKSSSGLVRVIGPDVTTDILNRDGKQSVSGDRARKGVYLPCEEYDVSLLPLYAVVLRPMVRKGNKLTEMDSNMIKSYGVTFESSDESVCTVGADGVVFPAAAGECKVTVRFSGGEQKVKIRVSEN